MGKTYVGAGYPGFVLSLYCIFVHMFDYWEPGRVYAGQVNGFILLLD